MSCFIPTTDDEDIGEDELDDLLALVDEKEPPTQSTPAVSEEYVVNKEPKEIPCAETETTKVRATTSTSLSQESPSVKNSEVTTDVRPKSLPKVENNVTEPRKESRKSKETPKQPTPSM